jgi:hypothetical protein
MKLLAIRPSRPEPVGAVQLPRQTLPSMMMSFSAAIVSWLV